MNERFGAALRCHHVGPFADDAEAEVLQHRHAVAERDGGPPVVDPQRHLIGILAVAASGTHVVRSGETLSSVAQRHGTTVRALVEANGISDPNLILAGLALAAPLTLTGGPASAASSSAAFGSQSKDS